MEANKKLCSMITEFFMSGKKLNLISKCLKVQD